MKITWDDIARKLTSRKFWVALAAFVAGIMVYRGADASSAESVVSLMMAGASALAYILGEGLVDARKERARAVADCTHKQSVSTAQAEDPAKRGFSAFCCFEERNCRNTLPPFPSRCCSHCVDMV